MNNNSGYIEKIIQRTGLSKKDIQERVEKKKQDLKGLISDEGALFIIAKELGVDIRDNKIETSDELEIHISDISLDMKNITLTGRIGKVYSVNNFTRKDGTLGLVGSFLLQDLTGQIRVTLWDEKTKIMENDYFQKNELVKLINTYVKLGINNEKEVHLGRNSKIILAPEDVNPKRYPKIKDEITPIKDIALNMRSISISGEIIQKFGTSEFIMKNGSPGQVSSIILADSTGTNRITFWNQDVDKLNEFNIDDSVIITNLYPRQNKKYPQKIDLHFSRFSYIRKVTGRKIEELNRVFLKINKTQEREGLINLRGIITQIDNLKRVHLKTNEDVSLLTFVVSDETGSIRILIWRDKAEHYSGLLKNGDGISLKNVLVKFNSFSSRNEISYISRSELEKIDLEIKNIKKVDLGQPKKSNKFVGEYTKISEISADKVVEIKGFIVKEFTNITVYQACPSCYRKPENCGCDTKQTPIPRLILNLTLDDESGTIRTSFIGDKAEQILETNTSDLVAIKETPEFEDYIKKISQNLLGKDIIIRGKAKFNDFSDSLELNTYDFKFVYPIAELERIMEEIES